MKKFIFAYVITILIFISLISVFSYGYGAGYVFISWRDLQIQTNIWILFIFICILVLFIRIIWYLIKYYLNHKKRKDDNLFYFKNLHPYEQLGVIFLLNSEIEQKDFIQTLFLKSGLLKGVIQSQIEYVQGNFEQALCVLDNTNPAAFELVELQRIRIYLALNDANKALTHLEFLTQHELSPWLNDVKSSYEKTLQTLWGEFAVSFPWVYLNSTQFGHLLIEHKHDWLNQLLQQFDGASHDQLEALKKRYYALSESNQLENNSYDLNKLWLKLLVRLSNITEEQEMLADLLLNQHFDEDVFYLWFQQQSLKQPVNYIEIEKKLDYIESKYNALPILSFVKWHILKAQQRYDEAEKILDLYPEHILMNYLRIKSFLRDNEDLIQQLNYIFENNPNHLVIRI